MPIVRIDDDVWQWLQGQARPFEDTPNSVLRRIAGLDLRTFVAKEHTPKTNKASVPAAKRSERMKSPNATGSEKTTVAKRVTGEQLNRKYCLGARHALYHKDGTFYERLIRFPGIFCDTRGFVQYDNEQQFTRDQRLAIGEKVNIHHGLASHPRYQQFSPAD